MTEGSDKRHSCYLSASDTNCRAPAGLIELTCPSATNTVHSVTESGARQLSDAEVQLTRLHYPEVTRGDFSQLTDADLAAFRGILDEHRVVTDESELSMYNTDWWRSCRGTWRSCRGTWRFCHRTWRFCNDGCCSGSLTVSLSAIRSGFRGPMLVMWERIKSSPQVRRGCSCRNCCDVVANYSCWPRRSLRESGEMAVVRVHH